LAAMVVLRMVTVPLLVPIPPPAVGAELPEMVEFVTASVQ
jgi:hypothetical protein